MEQPDGQVLTNGGTLDFGSVVQGFQTSLTFTVRNVGGADLTGLVVSVDGVAASEFVLTVGDLVVMGAESGRNVGLKADGTVVEFGDFA